MISFCAICCVDRVEKGASSGGLGCHAAEACRCSGSDEDLQRWHSSSVGRLAAHFSKLLAALACSCSSKLLFQCHQREHTAVNNSCWGWKEGRFPSPLVVINLVQAQEMCQSWWWVAGQPFAMTRWKGRHQSSAHLLRLLPTRLGRLFPRCSALSAALKIQHVQVHSAPYIGNIQWDQRRGFQSDNTAIAVRGLAVFALANSCISLLSVRHLSQVQMPNRLSGMG